MPVSFNKGKDKFVLYMELNVKERQVIFERAESVSQKMTWGFLTRRSKEYEEKGKKWMVVIWDNAWHTGKLWSRVREHNRKALRNGSIRIIPILLPKHSPWLNPLEAIVGEEFWGIAALKICKSRREESPHDVVMTGAVSLIA